MTVQQFGDATVGEVYALMDGYVKRRWEYEDLALMVTLAIYQTQCKKPPTYEKLTAYRKKVFQQQTHIEDSEGWRNRLLKAHDLNIEVNET